LFVVDIGRGGPRAQGWQLKWCSICPGAALVSSLTLNSPRPEAS
jgi:hypothetical protein